MTEPELTKSYEQTITLINHCVQQLYDLKEKVTEDYVKELAKLAKKNKEEYPEDAHRSLKDLNPVHPDWR